MDTIKTSTEGRGRDIRKLAALKERYRHEFMDAEERGALLDRIVKLEKKLGVR